MDGTAEVTDQEKKKRFLAEEILFETRLSLGEKLPYLNPAFALLLSRLEWREKGYGTDGIRCCWTAQEVLRLFEEKEELLERQLLHLTYHGMYLPMYRSFQGSERFWWLACDLLTEYRIDRLRVPGFENPVPAARSFWYRRLNEEKIPLCEQCLGSWLAERSQEELGRLEEAFRRDDHSLWRLGREVREKNVSGEREEYKDRCLSEIGASVHRWRTVFEQVRLRKGEHKKQAGGSMGIQSEEAQPVKLRRYDYRRFLSRFMISGEELETDPDSFDYIPYDYSRRMYESLVMLEPLEYTETQRLRELVIAIDTSGSCSGEVVRRFLGETWEILTEKGLFFRNMKVHLIQCDCSVQEYICIQSQKQWEEHLDSLKIKGHGDTDFTPVFRLIEQLRAEGKMKVPEGLLYFTDGDGVYPEEKPDYETAFVFLSRALRKGKAPDWAWELTLDGEA